jgi:predicted nucleotidyltransferase
MEQISTITKKIEELKPILHTEYAIESIGVFGSYPRGEQHKDSDLDILIEFSETVGLFKFIELENFLTRELGIKVDLVLKNALKPRIREGILKEVVYL